MHQHIHMHLFIYQVYRILNTVSFISTVCLPDALQKERAAREQQRIQELDEEQFDALSEEEKRSITQRHLDALKQQKLREQMEKELEEKRQQEEIQRLREEDLKKKKRSGKKDHKEVVKKKSFLERKHSSGTPNGQKMSLCNNSRESLVDAKEHSNSNEVHAGKEADDSQKQTEETETLNAEYPRPTSKVEKEKNADAAEIKRPMEDKELKKSKKVMEKDTKEVPEKRSLCGQKEVCTHVALSDSSVDQILKTRFHSYIMCQLLILSFFASFFFSSGQQFHQMIFECLKTHQWTQKSIGI
ncbi:uncharacterized protein LOC127534962 isoform X2 [Acanthochromis polyacanthus]|uniref:uncharacterized protein LOC127534962 isoform X2 n=1 Tax=Acanthochromis polyacanthus TaxID=80966 RepID=UPI0022345C25|nr:uncharacterized protein LOC127534962 isoform X2 [Acanthochromis polyacanthus]